MIGLGVYDCLAGEMIDSDSGEVYPALSCCNNSEMAARCSSPDADKVIWSVKANAQFNSLCAILLREAFRSGRIRLLCTEYEADNYLNELRGYGSLSESDKIKLKLPYINTTLLVDELTKLQHEESGGKIKVYEKAGMRKDRYSSLSYNYYVANQLEAKMNRRSSFDSADDDIFVIKPPKSQGKAVSKGIGRRKSYGWF